MKSVTPILKQTMIAVALLLLTSGGVFAQSGTITGKIFLPDGRPLNQSVRISLETIRGVKSSVITDNQGAFIFRGLTPGSYQLIVEADKLLWDTTTASIEVFPSSPAILNIVLKEKKTTSAKVKGGEGVSASELDSTIPAKARKEFERANDAADHGKRDEAIAHLRKAIEYFPNYLMAHNDLGAQLLEQGKLDEAEIEIRKAIAIDAKAFNPHLNLGIVLVLQKRFPEAKEVLVETRSLDSSSPAARLYLGQALEGLEDYPKALAELKAAHELGGEAFAVALFRMGTVYLKIAERDKAREAFQQYLSEAPKGPNAIEARRLLGTLN